MKRKVLSFLLSLLLLCVLVAPVGAGDYFLDTPKESKETPLLFQEFSDGHGNVAEHVFLGTSVVDIQTYGTVEGVLRTAAWNPKTQKPYIKHSIAAGTFALHGSGFVIKGGKILTCAHVVSPETATARIQIFAQSSIWPVKVLDRFILIGGDMVTARIVWIDHQADIALLEPIGNSPGLQPLPYDLDMHGLHASDPIIAVVVRNRDKDGDFELTYTVRFGTIKSLDVEVPEGFPSSQLPWFSMTDVTITTKLIPGDSGSPVFGFKNGRPVIIGIARAMAVGNDGVLYYMATIDRVYMMAEATEYWSKR